MTTRIPAQSMLTSVIASLIFVATAGMAAAQSGAQLYLQPVDSSGETLQVEVVIENVTDLYGAEFKLLYDPAVLSLQDTDAKQTGLQIEAGPLLPSSKGFIVANEADPTEGSITFALTLLNPAPAVSGSGTLAQLTFERLSQAPTTIMVERAKLVAVNLQTIPAATAPLALGDVVREPGPAPAAEQRQPAAGQTQPAAQQSQPAAEAPKTVDVAPVAIEVAPLDAAAAPEFPWWIVAAAIMVLGLIGITAFVLMTGLHHPPQSTETQNSRTPSLVTQPARVEQPRTVQRKAQAAPSARSRPSAFS